MNTVKIFLALGSLNAMLAVALGAFGAHGLKSRLPENMLAVYQTGVQYHFYHALGLLIVGLVIIHMTPTTLFKTAGWSMFLGILLFSGSLYILSITQIRWLGMITPLGGMAFIIAWILLFVGIIRAS